MQFLKSTTANKLIDIAKYGSGQFLPRVFTLINSGLIIKQHTASFWGEYVKIALVVNFVLMVLTYGNFQYLMKGFSQHPSTISAQWMQSFGSRIILLFPPLVLLAFFPMDTHVKMLLILWVLLAFFSQSFSVLVVFNKKFNVSFVAELLSGLFMTLAILILNQSLHYQLFIQLLIVSFVVKLLVYVISFRSYLVWNQFKVSINYLKSSGSFFLINLMGTLRVQADAYLVAFFLDNTSIGMYHILLSLLAVAESGASYFVTPFLKNLYRTQRSKLVLFKRRAIKIGVPFALILTLIIYVLVTWYYDFVFPSWYYLLIALFIAPQLLKILVVNELFMIDKHKDVSRLAGVFSLFSATAGWFLIPRLGLDAALSIRCLGFFMHFLVLNFWLLEKWKVNTSKI